MTSEQNTPAWMNTDEQVEKLTQSGMLTFDELLKHEDVEKWEKVNLFIEWLETNPPVNYTVEDYIAWRDALLAKEEADYERVEQVEPETVTHVIDGNLRNMVLTRMGLTEGTVTIQEEEWDLGMCDTCSYPESGFSVKVNDNLVWPSDEYLQHFGGYIYADREGDITGNELTSYGHFNAWLHGETFK